MALRAGDTSIDIGVIPLLQAERLSRSFSVGGLFASKQRIDAVADVDISLNEGDVLGLVGESGSGKSTLARLLLGLLAPSAGSIRFSDRDIRQLTRRELAHHIQAVFQDPIASLNPRRAVASIVALPLAAQQIGTAKERRRRVLVMLERVGLTSRHASAYPSELSGGERQRVAIARALVLQPKIVLFDEPTSALDVSVQSQILNLLVDLHRDLGLTYIFISHNLAVVEHVATRIAVMYLGRIVECTERDALFDCPRHPFTRMLLSAVLTPEPGLGVPDVGLGVALPDPTAPSPGCAFSPRCPHAGPRCRAVQPRVIRTRTSFVTCHLFDKGTENIE